MLAISRTLRNVILEEYDYAEPMQYKTQKTIFTITINVRKEKIKSEEEENEAKSE